MSRIISKGEREYIFPVMKENKSYSLPHESVQLSWGYGGREYEYTQ